MLPVPVFANALTPSDAKALVIQVNGTRLANVTPENVAVNPVLVPDVTAP